MATMSSIEVLSPAKLNLFLHVTGQRDDGYHTLQTVFQLLDWGDRLSFEVQASPGILLTTALEDVPNDDNLIIKAARALDPEQQFGATIDLFKQIPMGGGLGGGSSNAAMTLLALNKLWKLDHDIDTLAKLGETLGADVPVFVRGYSCWAEGIGEEITPIALPSRWFVILKPNCHVATAEIFRAPELTRNTAPITVSAFFAGHVKNDLQAAVESRYPEVRHALKWLRQHGSAMMTGSGACVFASYESQSEAERIARLAPETVSAFVAKGINKHPGMVHH
jgi:4-diphosphocytidyl-2-C-methyl-D-erythritol kinase